MMSNRPNGRGDRRQANKPHAPSFTPPPPPKSELQAPPPASPPAPPAVPFNPGPRPTRFAFNIASDFTEARAVQDSLLADIQSRSYSENDHFAIKLSLEEALINAIKHGNGLDPNKRVAVEALIGEDALEIVIHDQGPGFKREEVPDPTLDENLEKNSGRGILLIETYMTAAEWTDQGRRLRMSKSREPSLVPKP